MNDLRPPLLASRDVRKPGRLLRVCASDPEAFAANRLFEESQARAVDGVGGEAGPTLSKGLGRCSSDSDLFTLGARALSAAVDERYRLLAKGHHCCAEDATPICQTSTEARKVEGRSSEVATVLVILKAFVGGTMLVLPSSLHQTGLISGNLTLWVVGLLELWGMLKLVEAHQRCGGSFGQLARLAMGAKGAAAVESSIVLSQLGFTAAEMIYVAKTGAFAIHRATSHFPALGAMLGTSSQAALEPTLIWLQLIVAVPVSWYRELSALTMFNFVGNLLILSAVFVLSVVTVTGLADQGGAEGVTLSSPVQQVLVFTGFSVYAFEGITMVIPIYTAHQNKENFNRTLTGTIVAIAVLFSAFASANVVLYGDSVESILTLNLPAESALRVWVSVAFALGSLTLVFLMAFPTYEILEGRLQACLGPQVVNKFGAQHALRAVVICLCAVAARFGGQELDVFLSLVGAVGCVPLAFIYPCMIHLQLVADTTGTKLLNVAFIIFGFGVMIFCMAGAV